MEKINIEKEMIVKCPHCNENIIIEQINCAIFRHGIYKHNLQQIDPHLNKERCDELINNNKIFGCGKPFLIKKINNIWESEICDYI
jgi:hypothetical protein